MDDFNEEFTDQDIQNAREKANKYFESLQNKEKTESISDRLKSLKQQIEPTITPVESISDSVSAENESNTEVSLTKIDKHDKLSTFNTNLTDMQLDFINLMIPMQFNITDICREVGISRSTYYNWLEENEHFKTAYENTREYLVDKAEQVLLQSLNQMDAKTAQFVLKALNKRYKEKIDITSNGNTMGSIINILPPNNGKND